jgi:Leucine-rich repeat (LRR) protein
MVDSSKKITSLYLKTHTQKFDLLTIFLLDLSKKGISALGSIVECTNLLMLDVSYNGIQVINGIETLVNLKCLNISYNKLTQLDPLKACTALERLEVQGNQIKDTRTLESIGTSLVNLKVLYLQEFNRASPNPVCSIVGYRRKVYEAIPKLRGLDGYREGVAIMDPGQIEEGDSDNLQYTCDEEWYSPDIYLTSTVAKDNFNKTS